eukprot:CAMPEP_0201689388 /NCGR_PEP_ID=MMETSP0578-20130828/2996_1 /ASSEMBLY_ACC=CAM_ASM_000663 /TAXON_ID=267565 /ORGANISM="Skeletonema grethea, Strain CCMP 1804" /LENGTH=389 /DNA_ID=CAMNT_0048174017 /DNA_START=41 /DNA_END=1210 /DNA_ORIENTATION=-
MSSSPPENPFSSAADGGDNNRFDAFQLSPDKTSDNIRRSSLPSLQSIQAAQQMQQQQQRAAAAPSSQQQQSQSVNLPSSDELQGPINSTANNNPSTDNDWIPPSSSSTGIPNSNIDSSAPFLPKFLTCGGALSIESLRPYFDVDTADLSLRMKSSIKYANVPDGFRNEVLYSDNALRLAYRETEGGGGEGGESGEVTSVGNVNGTEGKGPDLYGPTWITMTLVFLLAVTSNMSLYFHHTGSVVDEGGIAAEEEWDYDINQLLHATWILYSFSFGLPMVLYVIFRLMGIMSFSLVDLICLYGYSLVAYIPSTFICVVPVSWLQWLSLCISTVSSGMLVLRNVTGPILESAGGGGGMGQGKTGGLIMAVIGCHFVFFLVMKLAFYHHVHAV